MIQSNRARVVLVFVALVLACGQGTSAIANDTGAAGAVPKAPQTGGQWPWGAWGFGLPPAPKVEAKPEPKVDPKAAGKVDPKAAAKIDAKAAAKVDLKPVPRADPKAVRPKLERTAVPVAPKAVGLPRVGDGPGPALADPAPGSEAPDKAQWTLGLAAGAPGSRALAAASELARRLHERDGLRVRPMVTAGETENLRDLVDLRQVDAAVVHADALVAPPADLEQARRKLAFVVELFHSPVLVLARPGIRSITELAGGRLSTGAPGAGAETTAPVVFRRLDIPIRTVAIDHETACAALIAGNLDAIVHVGDTTPCPDAPAAAGLTLLAVPAAPVADLYAPMTVGTVDTVGVAAVLAVYAWPSEHPRFRRTARLVDLLVDRFDSVRATPAPWSTLTVGAELSGWVRHPYVTTRLDAGATAAKGR